MPGTYVKKLASCISLLMLMTFISSCSEKNPDAPNYNRVHFLTWFNPLFANTEQFHGAQVEARGTAACLKCHELNGEGENIPGCVKCHFGRDGSKVPDGADWDHGLEGHAEFQDNQTVCNFCHDYERSFGTGPGTCHNCHGTGESHVLGQAWLDRNSPQFHGDEPREDCSDCHNLTVKCSQCHFGETGSKAPIGSGWAHGNNEEHEDYERYINTCNQCHALNRSYDNGLSNCHNCHDD